MDVIKFLIKIKLPNFKHEKIDKNNIDFFMLNFVL